MLPEIFIRNLNVVFVGTSITELSNDLGFHYLGANNRFWTMLEFARLTPKLIISPSERKVLLDAQHHGVLDDRYKRLFFEQKESELLKHRIGLTDLNRRVLAGSDADPSAMPKPEDVQRCIQNVEKLNPKIVAFVTSMDIFERCLQPRYPGANRQRGKQDFLIGRSEVWLLGSTSGRSKDTEDLEQVFEDLAERLAATDGSKSGGAL